MTDLNDQHPPWADPTWTPPKSPWLEIWLFGRWVHVSLDLWRSYSGKRRWDGVEATASTPVYYVGSPDRAPVPGTRPALATRPLPRVIQEENDQ